MTLPCLAQHIVTLNDGRIPDNLLKNLSAVQIDSIGKGLPIKGTTTTQDASGESRDSYSWQLFVDPVGRLRGDLQRITVDSVRGSSSTVTTKRLFTMDVDLIICCKADSTKCSTFRKYKKEYPNCTEWQIQIPRKVR